MYYESNVNNLLLCKPVACSETCRWDDSSKENEGGSIGTDEFNERSQNFERPSRLRPTGVAE